ncbi:hypothetical protein E2C01_011034 [Portunus trituberculatus]|uniref:Uncharacterized protein n=1 Tax=Portunus trituberculatus TaxID=210409 RepID=A0A5B7D9Y4_PORTR|nr:hypothetical protein [Portunus trituberculatus]
MSGNTVVDVLFSAKTVQNIISERCHKKRSCMNEERNSGIWEAQFSLHSRKSKCSESKSSCWAGQNCGNP